MKQVSRADYADYRELPILKYSRMHQFFVLLGFSLAVLFPIGYGIWVLLSARPIGDAVKMALYLLPFGFLCFVISFRSKASCRQCQGEIEIFWCHESDEKGRRSGPFAVCESCHAYEARLTSDDFS